MWRSKIRGILLLHQSSAELAPEIYCWGTISPLATNLQHTYYLGVKVSPGKHIQGDEIEELCPLVHSGASSASVMTNGKFLRFGFCTDIMHTRKYIHTTLKTRYWGIKCVGVSLIINKHIAFQCLCPLYVACIFGHCQLHQARDRSNRSVLKHLLALHTVVKTFFGIFLFRCMQ